MRFIGQDDAVTVPAGGFSAVYAFGDSLSDVGNVSLLTLRNVPVSPPYSGGGFSNGDIWVQDLARSLGLPRVEPSLAGGTGYAYGGAHTGATPVHAENPTDLPSQLGQFVASVPNPPDNALYTVWAGSNDVLEIANNSSLTLQQQQAAISVAVSNEVNFIAGLAAHGAENFVVMNVPDVAKTPYELGRPASIGAASDLAALYDGQLAQSLQQFVAASGVKLELVDTYGLIDSVVANPAQYGFSNVNQPLWSGNLTDSGSGSLAASGAAASGYLYFDGLHPTAQAHALLGSGVAQALTTPA
jgi:outer membrane lipase/esterase